jgi:hypothetical protein
LVDEKVGPGLEQLAELTSESLGAVVPLWNGGGTLQKMIIVPSGGGNDKEGNNMAEKGDAPGVE